MAVIDWTKTHLIPTDGLLAWHLYDPATSANGNINDASGNGKHLVQATNPPTLTLNVRNGQPGWLWDGTTADPLQTASSANVTAKHIFIFASYADASFSTNNRGLLSGKNTGNWLTSKAPPSTEWFSFGADYTYRKSDTEYADATMAAPMSGTPELMEMTHPTTGVVMDGIQVGRQTGDATRKWKGYFHEQMIYDRVLSLTERLQIMLYYNIKFGAWAQGVPLFFPAKDLLTETDIINVHWDDLEPDYGQITDSWTYEDGRPDFNEVAPTAPFGWNVRFTVPGSPGDMAQAFAYREIFEAFNRAARLVNPFNFTDKWGQIWSDVRIKEGGYRSTHADHKSWIHNISFELEASTASVVVGEMPSADLYLEDDGDILVDG